jgi:HlyD family secretion protein
MSNEVAAQNQEAFAPNGETDIANFANDTPDVEIRLGLIVAGLFFVIFLGWGALAPMDSAAYATGQLVVAGQRQTVQHRDGGVVGVIQVKEGQKVAKGQVLIELAGAEVRAQELALASQVISLQAQSARLRAELLGASAIIWPAEFAAQSGPAAAEVEKAKAAQLVEFTTRRSVLGAQTSVLGQQTTQAVESASGFARQMDSTIEQERLIQQELDSLSEVAARGFVSMTRIRALERAKAELQGRRGQYQASVAESGASANENRLRQIEAQKTYRERSSTELREVEFALSELLPKHNAAKDQLRRLQIRAPKSGTVVGLSIFTIGGVIAAGQRLMDVVPEKAMLVVEARVSVGDADDLRVG